MHTYRRGLFALSADPITNGHLDVIQKSLELCDEVVILVANNHAKHASYLFSLEDRLSLAKQAVALAFGNTTPRLTVVASDGLLVDVFLEHACDVVIRGIRNAHDTLREDEQQALYSVIDETLAGKFVYIQSDNTYAAVSSTWVKELVQIGVDVSPFVPVCIKAELERRLLSQILVGIHGPVATGKTWLATELVNELQRRGLKAQHIAIDDLVRELYQEQSPGAQAVRAAIAERFGQQVLDTDGGDTIINRTTLRNALFTGSQSDVDAHRVWIQELTAPHVFRLLRTKRMKSPGVVLIEWADFAQRDLYALVNNAVILTSAETDLQQQYALQRGLTPEEFGLVAGAQRSSDDMRSALESRIARDAYGECMVAPQKPTMADIQQLADTIDAINKHYTKDLVATKQS